jgi:hypothetical protein
MNQLLNDLITTPIVLGIIAVASLFVFLTLAFLADVYNDKHPYRKNPYIISAFVTFITLLTVSVGTVVRQNMVENNPLHYVKIQKTDKNLIITSKTMFIKSANLTVKENINNGVIVEHDGNEYVVRNDQLH